MERVLFEKIGLKAFTYFAFSGTPLTKNRSHTFLLFEQEDETYWFESSWGQKRGIHGPFSNDKSCLKIVKTSLEKDWGKSVGGMIRYDKFKYDGMNIPEFGEYIIKHFR